MAYKVRLDVFEGPFDLLVYLIESARMSIYDIQVSEITSQYMRQYEMMLRSSCPLILIRRGAEAGHAAELPAGAGDLKNISVAVNASSVVVNKRSDPRLTITLLHPAMISAFQTYLEQLQPDGRI